MDSAAPKGVRYTIFDTEITGFGLRVFSSGAKPYIFEYRPGEGGRRVPKRRITIGKVGDLTPDQAREAARKFAAQVSLGADPQAAKAANRAASTVAEIAERYLAEPRRAEARAAHGRAL